MATQLKKEETMMANTRGKRKETKPVDEVMDMTENMVTEETVAENTAEEKTETKPQSDKYGVVTCQNLNVRKAPTTASMILRIIPKDTEVKILSDVNESWYKVRVGEIENGFCMKKFISITD